MPLLALDRYPTPELPRPLQVYRSADWRRRFLFFSSVEGLSVLSPTWNFQAKLWQDYDPASEVSLTVSYLDGGLELYLSKAVTATLNARTYDFEVLATDPVTGVAGKLLLGKVVALGRRVSP